MICRCVNWLRQLLSSQLGDDMPRYPLMCSI
jgi:hypothetical protein